MYVSEVEVKSPKGGSTLQDSGTIFLVRVHWQTTRDVNAVFLTTVGFRYILWWRKIVYNKFHHKLLPKGP